MPAPAPADKDPLDAALRPPLDESPEETAFRLAQEDEARRVSQAIDESIRQEKNARKKNRVVRLLLLGQSESGASASAASQRPADVSDACRKVHHPPT